MVEIGKRVGKNIVALITEMDQPLGHAAGNSLEVIESIETLKGGGPADLRELCLELAGWMLVLGEKASTLAEGRKLAAEEIASGRALERFRKIIELQGGEPRVLDDYRRLPTAKKQTVVTAEADGVVESIQCEELGIACCRLGAGRERVDDRIDPAVGLTIHAKVGDRVSRGHPLVTLHYNDDTRIEMARALAAGAYRIGARPPAPRPLIFETLQ
jgi:thymidine phosphorylase